MIRPGDLTQFAPLVGGEAATFVAPEPRLVRLTISAPHPVAVSLFALDADGAPDADSELFAFKADGLEDAEFYVPGPFALMHDGDRVYLHCKDGDHVAIETLDSETFTTLYERRPRNPEIEALQEMLIRNQNRKFAAMYEDIENERGRLQREREALDQRARDNGGDASRADAGAGVSGGPESDGGGKDGKE